MDTLARLSAAVERLSASTDRLVDCTDRLGAAVQRLARTLRKADPMPEITVTDATLESLKIGADALTLRLREGEALGFSTENHPLAAALVAGRDELDRLAAEIEAALPRAPSKAEVLAEAGRLLDAAERFPVTTHAEARDALAGTGWSTRFA